MSFLQCKYVWLSSKCLVYCHAVNLQYNIKILENIEFFLGEGREGSGRNIHKMFLVTKSICGCEGVINRLPSCWLQVTPSILQDDCYAPYSKDRHPPTQQGGNSCEQYCILTCVLPQNIRASSNQFKLGKKNRGIETFIAVCQNRCLNKKFRQSCPPAPQASRWCFDMWHEVINICSYP